MVNGGGSKTSLSLVRVDYVIKQLIPCVLQNCHETPADLNPKLGISIRAHN